MTELVIYLDDKTAEALVTLRRISGDTTIEDFICSAIHRYQWILAQQSFDHYILSECPDECLSHPDGPVDVELPMIVKDAKLGRRFFGSTLDE